MGTARYSDSRRGFSNTATATVNHWLTIDADTTLQACHWAEVGGGNAIKQFIVGMPYVQDVLSESGQAKVLVENMLAQVNWDEAAASVLQTDGTLS